MIRVESPNIEEPNEDDLGPDDMRRAHAGVLYEKVSEETNQLKLIVNAAGTSAKNKSQLCDQFFDFVCAIIGTEILNSQKTYNRVGRAEACYFTHSYK